jgi:hypothetical protein
MDIRPQERIVRNEMNYFPNGFTEMSSYLRSVSTGVILVPTQIIGCMKGGLRHSDPVALRLTLMTVWPIYRIKASSLTLHYESKGTLYFR